MNDDKDQPAARPRTFQWVGQCSCTHAPDDHKVGGCNIAKCRCKAGWSA